MQSTGPVADLAIIIVSTNEARWLEPCLRTVFDHAGDTGLDVVVVDNESTGGTRERGGSRQRGDRRDAWAGREPLPGGSRGPVVQPGIRARQQPRRDDLQCALRP